MSNVNEKIKKKNKKISIDYQLILSGENVVSNEEGNNEMSFE